MVSATTSRRNFVSPTLLWRLFWFWLSGVYSLPLFFPDNLYAVTAATTILSALLAAAFLVLWLGRPFKIRSRLSTWVIAYFAWVAFVSILSPYVWQNWLRSAGLLTSAFSLFIAAMLGSRFVKGDQALILAGRAYVFGAVVVTISLIVLGAEQSARLGNDEYLHPNALGFLYGSALSFALSFRLYRFRLLRLAMAMGLAVLLILTFSKTALVAMLFAFAVAIIFERGWRRARLALTLLATGGVASVLLLGYIQQQIQAYTANPYLVETLTGRTVLWRWTLEMADQRHWLGYGFATFRDIFSPFSLGLGFVVAVPHPHNAFLDALFVGGYPGLILFIFVVLGASVKIMHHAKQVKSSPLASFLALTTVFVLMRSITEGSLDLGRDFVILISLAILVEASSARRATIIQGGIKKTVCHALEVKTR